jgi:hypothetical protein
MNSCRTSMTYDIEGRGQSSYETLKKVKQKSALC